MRIPHKQSGDRVWLEGNRLTGNNTGGEFAELYIAGGLRDVCAVRNRIEESKGPAIHVEPGSTNIFIAENSVNGQPQTEASVSGDRTSVSFQEPENFPPIGPETAAKDSALHLNIPELGPPG